ncbi:MAG TPA: DUF222 domain-containing protein, partial [Urbifossiella sp.]|nr:DUF222 domain-containing protein [Urbifossiella sp.]
MTAVVGGAVGFEGDDLGPDDAWLSSGEELPDELLLALDPASVPGEWADAGMAAAFRMENHFAWARSRWTWEASRASAGTTVRVSDRPRAGKIPAATLGWSEQLGATKVEFARQVLVRLPALGEAMREGWLEEHKAEIVVSTVAELDDAQARRVVELLLGGAPGWSYKKLGDRVEATAKAVDPGWAEARKAAAIARRRVVLRPAPSGAADLSGLDLPPEPAQDAFDRIVALAGVVHDRLRSLGRDAPRGPIQTEVLLTLTGPDGAGLWDDDVIELVVSRFTSDGPGPGPGDGEDPDGGPDGGPEAGPAGPGDEPEGGPDDGLGGGGGPGGPTDPDAPLPGEDVESAHLDDDPDEGHDGSCAGPEPAGGDGSVRRAVPFTARVAIRLGLATALGLDRRPGEVPGQGSVCSSTARALAWDRADAHLRLLLYDEHHHLAHALTLPPIRHGPPTLGGRRRRHTVEFTAHTHHLDHLVTGAGFPRGIDTLPPDALRLLQRAEKALAAARARPAHQHPAVTTADAHRRRPGAELARWVQARDHTCRGMGCERQATGADLDHTLDWIHGGQTTADDLGVFCQGDHLFKHDPTNGWTVEQPHPGTFVWTAPTGRRHVITPEPYDPLPDPLPPADGAPLALPADLFAPAPRAPDPFTPRRNRHGHITEAARDTAEHLAAR